MIAALATGVTATGLYFYYFTFSISTSPSVLWAQAHVQNPLTIMLKSQNGFTGVVLLKTLPSSKVSTRFSPDTVPLASISNSTLWIDPLSAGNYSITIVASNQGVSHFIDVSIIAEDLQMSFTPASLTIARSTSENVTLTLYSLNGLTGYLNLPGYVSRGYVYAYETPSRVFLPRGGIVTTNMNVSADAYPTASSFPVTAQICCFSPISSPPGAPLWNFGVYYNLTIT